MRGSRIASLGRSTLGCSSLGIYGESLSRAVGSLPPAPSKPTAESILSKMQAEQPELAESAYLWYDPILQGITNDQLFEDNINYGRTIIRDLFDNGYDNSLLGVAGMEGDGHIDHLGLHFDGFDDWIKDNACSTAIDNSGLFSSGEPFTIIWSGLYSADKVIGYQVKVFQMNGNTYVNIQVDAASGVFRLYGRRGASGGWRIPIEDYVDFICLRSGNSATDGLFVLNTSSYELPASAPSTGLTFYMNGSNNNGLYKNECIFRGFIIFRRQLSDDEIQWVRDNMINY